MTRLKTSLLASLSAAMLLLVALGAQAQVPSVPPPYNVPLGAVITNTASPKSSTAINSTIGSLGGAGANLAYKGVICTVNQSAQSGSASASAVVQMYDTASATWQNVSPALITSATPNTPASVVVYPGIQTTSLPTGWVSISMALPKYWRVSEVIGGATNSTFTGTVGCDLLK